MSFVLVDEAMVIAIHDKVLNPGELTGLARDKSLAGALARVQNRLAYGMISDVCDLAAAYTVAVATGHCFNDGNKRTAFRVMQVVLWLNSVETMFEVGDTGPFIIAVAQGKIDEGELADWLRASGR